VASVAAVTDVAEMDKVESLACCKSSIVFDNRHNMLNSEGEPYAAITNRPKPDVGGSIHKIKSGFGSASCFTRSVIKKEALFLAQ
jgi:hypothetical protein